MPQSGYYGVSWRIAVLCTALIVAVFAFAFNMIYYGKWRFVFKRAYLSASLALLTAVLLLGGIGAPSFSLTGLGVSAAIAISMFFPYSMLVNCGEYKGRRTVEYFSYIIITVSVVIFAAVIKQYIKYDLTMSYHPKDKIVFGYAISNTAAAFVVIAIPMTFYLIYTYKHGYLFFAALTLEVMTIILTSSRASMIVVLFTVPVTALILGIKKKRGKILYWIALAIVSAVVFGVVVAYWKYIIAELKDAFTGGVDDSGRFELWNAGLEAWKHYPVFGLGIWYLPPINDWYYSFHCTPLTYLYCTGIVGLVVYLYHRYKTVRLVFDRKITAERAFLAISVAVMLCNALLDIAMTSPPHLLYYGIMLALIECDAKAVNSGAADAVSKDKQTAASPQDISEVIK